MNALSRDYASKGLSVIAISIDKDPEAAREEARLREFHFPALHDPRGLVKERLKTTKIPETYVLDGESRLASVYTGMNSDRFTYLRKRLHRLLEEGAPE